MITHQTIKHFGLAQLAQLDKNTTIAEIVLNDDLKTLLESPISNAQSLLCSTNSSVSFLLRKLLFI